MKIPHYLRVTRAVALVSSLATPVIAVACGGSTDTPTPQGGGDAAADGQYGGIVGYDGGPNGVVAFEGGPNGVVAYDAGPEVHEGGPIGVVPYVDAGIQAIDAGDQ